MLTLAFQKQTCSTISLQMALGIRDGRLKRQDKIVTEAKQVRADTGGS